MRKEYDFSKSVLNLYLKKAKNQRGRWRSSILNA